MVEVTDEMAKKMMAGTAYETIELEDVDMDFTVDKAVNKKDAEVKTPFNNKESVYEGFGKLADNQYGEASKEEIEEFIKNKNAYIVVHPEEKDEIESHLSLILNSHDNQIYGSDVYQISDAFRAQYKEADGFTAEQKEVVHDDNQEKTREYTDEEKNRFGRILRAKYSDRSMTDYIECQEYLASKTKHLAHAKQAQEKLRSQALTYMQSVMDSEKRKTLPKDVLLDVANNGHKFIEKFGYDADGATNPVTMKFRDWMDRNQEKLQSLQKAKTNEELQSKSKKDTSILKEIWNEREVLKPAALLVGSAGAFFGAMGGVPGFAFGGLIGAATGAGVAATMIVVHKIYENRQEKRKAKALEKAKQTTKENAKQLTKSKEKTSIFKAIWEARDVMKPAALLCGTAGALFGAMGGVPGFAIGGLAGAAVGTGIAATMAAVNKVYENIQEKRAAKKQAKANQKVKANEKQMTEAKKSKINWHEVSFWGKTVAGCSALGAGVGGFTAYAAAHATALGVAGNMGAITTALGTGAVIGAAAVPVMAGAYKVGSWISEKVGNAVNNFKAKRRQKALLKQAKKVKAFEAQNVVEAKNHVQNKINTHENEQPQAQYKGKVKISEQDIVRNRWARNKANSA